MGARKKLSQSLGLKPQRLSFLLCPQTPDLAFCENETGPINFADSSIGGVWGAQRASPRGRRTLGVKRAKPPIENQTPAQRATLAREAAWKSPRALSIRSLHNSPRALSIRSLNKSPRALSIRSLHRSPRAPSRSKCTRIIIDTYAAFSNRVIASANRSNPSPQPPRIYVRS